MRFRPAVLVLPLALLAACGGDDAGGAAETDEQAIQAILDERRSDPASICEHMTATLLEQVGGAESCRRQAEGDDSGAADTAVDGIDVEGDRATVRMTGPDGDQSIAFVREDGEWRLTRSP